MKKYLLSLSAVVLAVSFSAFSMPKKINTTFKYQPSTYTQAQVESVAPSSWLPGIVMCAHVDNKACGIEVDNIYTHIDGQGRRVLNDASAPSHVTIAAATIGDGNYYVDLINSINLTSVSNKE